VRRARGVISFILQCSQGWILKDPSDPVKKTTKPLERLRPRLEQTGSVSDPPTEKRCSEKQNLQGDFSAAVFNFTLNNTESMLGFL